MLNMEKKSIIAKMSKNLNLIYHYPFKNQKRVNTIYYNEIPNPLPEIEFSGNPISLYINKYKLKDRRFKLLSFKMYNGNKKIESYYRYHKNDVNNKLDEYTHVIFPKLRLEYNNKYCVVAKYLIDKEKEKISWCFKTKKLKYEIIDINNDSKIFNISLKNNNNYYLRLKNNGITESLKKYSINKNGSYSMEIYKIDMILLKLKIKEEKKIKIKLNNKIIIISILP